VDVVTARALAPLPKLLGLCRPFFGPDTLALLLKGREAERETEEARADWQFEANLVPSVTDSEARIAVITKLQAHSG
jgi:16S rRNA (guanine527-N7)-methyltransferase